MYGGMGEWGKVSTLSQPQHSHIDRVDLQSYFHFTPLIDVMFTYMCVQCTYLGGREGLGERPGLRRLGLVRHLRLDLYGWVGDGCMLCMYDVCSHKHRQAD